MKLFSTLLLSCAFSVVLLAQNADINLLREINNHRNRALDPTFRFITNTATPISIAAPVAVFTAGLIKKDRDLLRKGIYLGETFAVSAFISFGLKYSVRRERPFITYPFIEKATDAGSPSFPSGHTSTVFATATSLSIAFPKWYVIAPSFLWASAVGYSRMHLGVHYPSDVLAGAVIGSGAAWLTWAANKWISKKRVKNGKPKLVWP